MDRFRGIAPSVKRNASSLKVLKDRLMKTRHSVDRVFRCYDLDCSMYRLRVLRRVSIPVSLSPSRPCVLRATRSHVATRAKGGGRFDADASREMQIESSRYLAQLLDAPNVEEKAEELAEKLTENFFTIATTYLEMAKKENQPAVVERLESVIKIAMKAKNRTLRPEIQLLNSLLEEESKIKRAELLTADDSVETLKMNDQYFFKLLDRMMQDVKLQPDSVKKAQLVNKLVEIRKAASRALFV